MADPKMAVKASAAEIPTAVHRVVLRDVEDESVLGATKSTTHDANNMRRMGRKQQLIRDFKLFPMVSLNTLATAPWEFAVFSVNQGLIDGGRAGLFWSFIWCFIGFLPIVLSLAEMASMAPISGAQYHWVSEFAPRKYQKTLSYFTGWFSTLSWQSGNAIGIFITGQLVQTLILMNDADYSYPNWHGTLLVIAVCLVTLVSTIFGSRFLPFVQYPFMVLHCATFFVALVPIWVKAPQASAWEVFLGFENFGGWSSMPLAVMAGQLTSITTFMGIDTATHMAEEIKDAGRNVPKAMVYTFFGNTAMAFAVYMTIIFALPDVDAALKDDTGYPYLYILRQTMSNRCASALVGVTVFLFAVSNVDYLAAVGRDLFAFARDEGVPFSKWISSVNPKRHIPSNAIIVSCGFCTLLSLLYIGSPVTYYALLSMGAVAILQCYMFSIGCLLWRRVYYPETLPPAQWSLGRWGIPLNIAAMISVVWFFFWAFWPQTTPVTLEGFNWASVVFTGVFVIAFVWYFVKARRVYTGPVVLVEHAATHHELP